MAKCLILSDAEGCLTALRPLLETHGLIAVPEPVDAELFCAREAGRGLFLLGAGEGCTRALFLAERYPVQGLILIGRPARPRPASPLWRRVERDLFSVVCDVLVIQPLADRAMPPRAAETVLRAVSSRRKEAGYGARPCRSVDKLRTSARGGHRGLHLPAKQRKNTCT